MPTADGFDHLPYLGQVYHRCIEEGCTFPEGPTTLTEKERKLHAAAHEREREKERNRKRKAALAIARQAKKLKDKEAEIVADRYDSS
jgi:hypothetical protein